MTRDEYEQLQNNILLMAGIVADWDLDGMLQAISRADTFGPILDARLWQRGHGNMDNIKELAQAFKRVQSVARRLRNEAAE